MVVTFETRGRGGQIVTYPSKGYKILGKITNVKRISPVERDVIFRVARTMDEMQKEVVVESKRIGDIQTQDQTPWGEFRATHTALDILALRLDYCRGKQQVHLSAAPWINGQQNEWRDI